MRALLWLLRIGLFFLLFALALNNQHEVALKSLFGYEWRAPMVFIVLAAFVGGCAMGIFGMLPAWWRQRRTTSHTPNAPAASSNTGVDERTATAAEPLLEHPPRDGL